MKILKFGGTSVGKPERMKQVAALVSAPEAKIVVISALSGTTNSLVDLSAHYFKQEFAEAKRLLASLRVHYDTFVESLLAEQANKDKAAAVLNSIFGLLDSFGSKEGFSHKDEKVILAQGEILSTNLFILYLVEAGYDAVLLDALKFMKTDADSEPDSRYMEDWLEEELQAAGGHSIYLTQGYICLNHKGEIDNLKRGGSDYTASLVGAAIHAEEIQIWTDIDGMHNNDPRVVAETRPIATLSFDEAAELAYFGAKILHPSSIRPAHRLGIPVRLLNTMEPTKPGTVITAEVDQNVTTKAVAAKDGITAIKIKSGRMLLAYGFMRRVFEVFERHKTSIDMVTTSEVGVSITIDDASALEDIVSDLEELGQVEVDRNQTIVCVVGWMPAEKEDVLTRVFACLSGIPVRMASYGGSRFNVSFLINSSYKNQALKQLNEGLFGLRG